MKATSLLCLSLFLEVLFFTSAVGQINPNNNVIGVDVSTFPQNSSFTYDSCFRQGSALGMGIVGLFQNWTALETGPSSFNLAIMDIANLCYPAFNMPIDLTIAPIHTNNLEVPSDLTNTAFNNLLLINRFKTLLDSIKAHIPNVVLSSLVIGSEHDVYLGTNSTLWSQYTTFYDSVSAYAKILWPGLKVATELTFPGITTQITLAQTLNTNSDYIGVSYYPLDNNFAVKPTSTIPTDFATLVGLYPTKPLVFYQYGYPSSADCNSSELQQAQFISQTFTTWDFYAAQVKMIDFTWLHDLDTAAVNFYGTYYGLTDTAFLEFLRTLGLRTWGGNGTNKLAFRELQCQAKQRGFNNLNISCASGIAIEQSAEEDKVLLYPNPLNNELQIEITEDLMHAPIRIYNSAGKLVKQIHSRGNTRFIINDLNLPDGVYYLNIQNEHLRINRKFIIHLK